MTISVLIADDHPLFLAGLARLIEDLPATRLAGTARTGEEAVTAALELAPDVVIMDLHLPGISGVEAIRRILAAQPAVRVLVLTMMDDDSSVFAAMRAGSLGYVLKGAESGDILRAIESVAAGELVFGAALASRIMQFLGHRGAARDGQPFAELTVREHQVLEQLAAGTSNAVIARRLGLSEKTVRNNVSAVFTKLKVTDRAAAVARARDAGLGG